jgi:hypothetical protein
MTAPHLELLDIPELAQFDLLIHFCGRLSERPIRHWSPRHPGPYPAQRLDKIPGALPSPADRRASLARPPSQYQMWKQAEQRPGRPSERFWSAHYLGPVPLV